MIPAITFSQSGNVKDIRQTYLWDVTLSMQGKAPGCPDIWNKVKEAMISDIKQISDDRTEIVVIPFQHEALETWREFATPIGKASLIKKISNYQIPRYIKAGNGFAKAKSGGTTFTYLAPPLKYVVDNILSEDKVDVLKFMTDGEDEAKDGRYEKILKQWCEIAKAKDAYGFYIVLTEAAKAGKVVLENINPCRFDVVDVREQLTLSFNTISPKESISFNVRDDYGKPLTIKFNKSGNGNIPDGYKIHITSWSNPYIQIDEIVALKSDNSAEVKVQYLMKKEEMIQTLSTTYNEQIHFKAEPADGMDQLPYSMTRVLDNPSVMEMINKPEKTVKFHVY